MRTVWRPLAAVILAVMVLDIVAAAFERQVEPQTFPTLGRALWWSVVTVATIGYGDVVPATPRGQAVAALLILLAMAWVPLVNTIVMSRVTKRQNADAERRQRDLIEDVLARLERIENALRTPPER
jgi:voltage-gated potassium channel Kch